MGFLQRGNYRFQIRAGLIKKFDEGNGENLRVTIYKKRQRKAKLKILRKKAMP